MTKKEREEKKKREQAAQAVMDLHADEDVKSAKPAPASTYLTGGGNTASAPHAAAQQKQAAPVKRDARQTAHSAGTNGGAAGRTQAAAVRGVIPASAYLTGGSGTASAPYAAGLQAPVLRPVLSRSSGGTAGSVRRPLTMNLTPNGRLIGGFGTRANVNAGTALGDLRQQEYEQARQRDMQAMLQNSAKWHKTNAFGNGDWTEEQRGLFKENNALRAKYGLRFEPRSGVTYRNAADGTRENMLNPAVSVARQRQDDSYAEKQRLSDELDALTEEMQEKYPYLLAMEADDRKGDAALYYLTHPQKMGSRLTGVKQIDGASDGELAEMRAVYGQYAALVQAKNELQNGGGFGYSMQNALLSAANAIENAGRGVSAYANKAVGDTAALLTGGEQNAVSRFFRDTAKNTLQNSVTGDLQQKLNEKYQPVGMAKKAADITAQAYRMTPTIAASAALPGAGMAALTLDSAASSARGALQGGASLDQAALYGALSGGLEYGTENMFGGIPGLPKGVADSAMGKALKSKFAMSVIDTLGEGAEEAISTAVDPVLRRMTWDENAPDATKEELVQSTVMGVLLSGVLKGTTKAAGKIGMPRLTRADGSPGLNVDNAAGGTYNQNTEGGVENGGQMDSGRGRNGLPKNDLGIGVAYDSAGLRGAAGDRAEVGATAGRNQPVYSSDSEGRRIAPEVNEKISGTAIADSDGRPVSVYHSTPDMDFTTFDKGDVGFHFGTQEQAAKRSNDKGGIRTIRAYLNIKNPYRVSLDIMSWRPEATAIKLYADGVISEQDYNSIVELSKNENDYHSEASKALREMLAAKGYDGIVYPNGFEGDGNSYIALYPEQVVIADDGKGGGARGSSGGQGVNPDGSVGAARSGFDPYSHMQNEYGTIPPGEAPRAREVDVPQSTDGTDRVSRYARTLMEAPATPDEFVPALERQVTNGLFSHKTRKDTAALQAATAAIERNGWNGALRQWQDVVDGSRKAGKEDIALAQIMYAEAAKVGDVETAMNLAAQIAAEGTRAGQEVQALRLLKKATPEGKLYYARKSVAKLQEELSEKYGNKAPNLKIDEAIAREFLTAETDDARDAALDKLYTNVAEQIPKTFGDRLNTWRYFAMLGNPRTHIRNIVGNIMFQMPVRAKNKVGAVLEKAFVPKEQRTKSIFRDRAAKKFAKADYAEMAGTISGNKYTESQEIKSRQKLFPKPLQAAMNANTKALDAEDAVFKKSTYVNSMAEFLTARGADVTNLDTDTLEQARSYAKQEALKATFQDASATANKLSAIEREGGAAGVLVGGLVPFKRTPINIIKRGIEYSPVGLVKGLTYDLGRVRNGTITATEAIDHISAGATGTMLSVLGAFLAAQGLLSGEGDENDKKRNFDLAQGSQEYALNIGDYTYTIDWASPAAMPLFVGVEIWNAMQEKNEGITLSAVIDSIYKIMSPAFNLTVLDGVSGALKSAAYAKENPIAAVITNTVQNFAGQVVPTFLGQAARTIDDTRRTTYHDHDSPLPRSVDTFLQRQMNKIPGLSKSQPAYTDVWGRPDKTENAALRAFENFLSPGYISKKQSTEAEKALSALYDATGDAAVLPSKPQNYITVNGETQWLTAEQYLRYANEKGQGSLAILNRAVSGTDYKDMRPGEQAQFVTNVYQYADQTAKSNHSQFQPDTWVRSVQQAVSRGVPVETALAYRTRYGNLAPDMDEDGNTVYSKNDKLRDMLFGSDLSAAQKNALDDMLISDKKAVDYVSADTFRLSRLDETQQPKYQAAMDAGVSYDEVEAFQTFYSEADAKDENGNSVSGLKKQRILDYLAESGMDEAQQKSVLEAFTTYKTDSIAPRAVNGANSWAVNPVKASNATVVSGYGLRSAPNTTYGKGSSNHRGVDIGGTGGNLDGQETDTVGDGTVQTVAYDPQGYGNYVIIDHGNGYKTLYGHLQKATVKQGQTVKAGQQIGVIGGTGNVEAPHLHLSAWKNGKEIDPATVIPGF